MTFRIRRATDVRRLLTSWLTRGATVSREGGRFFVAEQRKNVSFSLAEIVSIAAMRANRVTYDEDFLVLKKSDGSDVCIGELSRGFCELEQEICGLHGFPTNWRMGLEHSRDEAQIVLWSRSQT